MKFAGRESLLVRNFMFIDEIVPKHWQSYAQATLARPIGFVYVYFFELTNLGPALFRVNKELRSQIFIETRA